MKKKDIEGQVQPVVMQSEQVKKAMKEIAQRKPGNRKLVYRKSTKTIVIVDRSGQVLEDTGFTIPEA